MQWEQEEVVCKQRACGGVNLLFVLLRPKAPGLVGAGGKGGQ